MADDRANNPARTPNITTESLYKSLEGKKNIASVSLPSRGDMRPGTGKWDFGGGRPRVEEYNEEELGPREMTKFDKNNKYHVGILTATDDSNKGMMLHSGGYFSFPKKDATAKTKPKAASKKAVAEGAPIAGTAGAAKARSTALAANEAKMAAARKRLAENKKK
jgi:hypothetical protein